MNKGTKSVNVRDYYNHGYKEVFQKGKLEQKKEGLFIMNGSNVDLRICETEAISEDEDEINQIGVIKSGCGLRVYPKYNSIYIEQLQKESNSQQDSSERSADVKAQNSVPNLQPADTKEIREDTQK